MDKKKKLKIMLEHFKTLTPLMFFQNYICFENKQGETVFWDNMIMSFTTFECQVHYVNKVTGQEYYRDDELLYYLFCAYEFLSTVDADHITLKVLTSIK